MPEVVRFLLLGKLYFQYRMGQFLNVLVYYKMVVFTSSKLCIPWSDGSSKILLIGVFTLSIKEDKEMDLLKPFTSDNVIHVTSYTLKVGVSLQKSPINFSCLLSIHIWWHNKWWRMPILTIFLQGLKEYMKIHLRG